MEVIYLWDQVLILCLFSSCYSSPWRIWFVTASKWNASTKTNKAKTKKKPPHVSCILVFLNTLCIDRKILYLFLLTLFLSQLKTRCLPLSWLFLPPRLTSSHPSIRSSFLIFFRLNKQGSTLPPYMQTLDSACTERNNESPVPCAHPPSLREAGPEATAPALQKWLPTSQNPAQSPGAGDKVVSLIFQSCS